jgi:hypothetical protein
MAAMPIRRSRRSKALAAQTVDLAFAVPQVLAHRVARMAIAGAKPSARDRQELYRMSTEKFSAFNEAWSSMAMETWLANQKLALSFMQSLWFPWARPMSGRSASTQLGNAALDILAKGMTPIRRRGVANARRLGRPRRRR